LHRRRSAWPLIVGFAVLAVLIAAGGYWAWRQQAESMQTQAERSLAAVGKLKADQIATWMDERMGDAKILHRDRLLSTAVADLLAGRGTAASAARVRAFLAGIQRTYGYVDVTLVAPGGSTVMQVPASALHVLDPSERTLVAKSQSTGQIVSSDLHLGADGQASLEFATPLAAERPGGAPVASVVLHLDPNAFLYPFIQDWPLPSRSGETLLVERRGDQVVYLNELRFRKNTALKLTTPVSAPDRPAAMAVRGRRGVVQGLDYRGVPVLAALQRVPSSPWFIVAKEDTDEVLGAIRTRGWLTAGFALVLVALAGLGTLLLWRARETQASAEISESAERYRALVQHAPMAIYVNREDRVVLANDACLRLFGASSPEQLLGKSPFDLLHPDSHASTRECIHRIRDMGEQAPQAEEKIVRLDGSVVDVEVATAAFPDQGVTALHVVLNDITARKLTEAQLRETTDYLENLLGYANAPVIVWDPELRITRFNHAFEDLTHLSADEVVGRHLELLFPDDERRAQALERVTSATAGERWQVVEIPILRADGEVRTVLWNSATLYADDEVTPIATIAQGQDITERVVAEQELRESEDKFKYIFDHSVIGMSLTLPSGGLRVNDAFCRMLGYSRSELEHRTWQEVSHPDDIADTQRRVEPLQSGTADSVRFIKRYLRKDGAVVWADVATALRRTASGTPLYYMTAVVDITEQRRASQELRETSERLALACFAGGVGIWELDVVNDALIWDEQMFRLYGIAPDQFSGTYAAWRAGVHPEDRPRSEAELEMALHREEQFDSEFRVVWPNGTVCTIRSLARVYRDAEGRATKLIGTDYDITDFKRAEDEIRLLNVELEQRVIERTSQLDAANKELEAFAYSVSHDLRAPLRHISGFSALLAERVGDDLDERSRHYVDTISRSVREMGVLIDDLLQFSRTGRADLQITDVDMDATLAEALAPLQRETGDRDIEWSIGPLPRVVGDHSLLRQVWANLLGNAVKYSRGRAPAHIEVGARDGDGGAREDVFWVRDDGAGFDMTYAHKLFGVFQRLHDSSEFEGTGIGLANVQRIVNRHGGRVWAEGELDSGATFYFSLPRRKETAS
jgi:PAS domain S-box-containing protein